MERELTRQITAYILHDPIQNMEAYITNFDQNALSEAEQGGSLIIAEYNDGGRELVKASEVIEPNPMVNGLTIVAPPYVDKRMAAVIDVFDALAAEMFGAAMVMSADADPAAARSPFAEALEKLKELVGNGAE